jgi:hypothetical protein
VDGHAHPSWLISQFAAVRPHRPSSAFAAGDKAERSSYYRRALRAPRRSTIRQARWTADDLPMASKTIELEQRISKIEGYCADMQEQMALIARRLAALQAELAHLVAKNSL